MSKKAEKKKAEKIIEDRTFGLKNKNKSKAVQKYVKGVEQTVKHQGISMGKLQSDQFEKRKMKKKEQEEKALLNSLYNDVNRLRQEDDSEEDDPANIVCPYFKQGLCQKGKKCIYSHDLTLDRTEEIDLYVDQRTQLIMNAIGGKELNELSEEELNKMIGQKERQYIKGCRSDIVCKFFLQAVEKDKYGWNWSCPNNGDRCKYKHCLPPGYKLKKAGGNTQVQQQKIDIEQKIDEQRNKLLAQNKSSPLVTYEVFLKWKEDRRIRKQADLQKKRNEQQKKNKNKGQLRTGRQLFTLDPTLFIDDEQAADEYEQQVIFEQQNTEDQHQNEDELQQDAEKEQDQQTFAYKHEQQLKQ